VNALILVLLALMGALIFFFINYRTIMSVLAGIAFLASLIFLPSIIAGSHEGVQILAFFGIVLIVYMSVGRDIVRDRRLNFFMGGALLIGTIFNFTIFCRRGL
jgi:uncharacterized membrane protein (UPF0136 family)